jgi:4-diphosphocytidyl-2-C-methyl-D-erythritol kinase
MPTVYAPAKVNLVLEVLGKCGDYHRISSILQTIDLCDVLSFEPAEELSFRCSEPALEGGNLAMEAARLVK